MIVRFSFAEWFRLFSIILNVPYNNTAMAREIIPLAEALEPTEEEKEAWGWRESIDPISGSTTYQVERDRVLAWNGCIERDLDAIQLDRLRFFVDNPPEGVPWRAAEIKLYQQIWHKLEVKNDGE